MNEEANQIIDNTFVNYQWALWAIALLLILYWLLKSFLYRKKK
ncbi:MAG: hypothetical protein WBF83_02300 [Moheibacter sp.]